MVKTVSINLKFLWLFVIVILTLFITSCASSGTSSNNNSSIDSNSKIGIPYRGVGITIEEAKNDAIRAALSIHIPQYVTASRKVVNSSLEVDETISTMSGYINSFEIVDQYIDESGFTVITALIKVSEKGVRNYAASRFEVINTNKNSDVFDGKNISGQILAAKRKQEAERARKYQQYISAKQLAERLFAGYPYNVMEVNVTDINFDPDRPERIRIAISYDLNEDFRKEFWKKVTLIDNLLTDSNERTNIQICANSGSVFDGCKRIPIIDLSFIDNDPALAHHIVVPVYSSNGKYQTCFSKYISPPIGIATSSSMVSGTAGDLAVGVAGLTGATAGVVGAVAVGTAAVAVALPFALIGAVVNPDSGDSEIEYTKPELVWKEPSKRIHVLGPNPFSTDFKASKFDPRLVWWDGKSSLLFNEKMDASEYLPFVIARKDNKIYFNGGEKDNSIGPPNPKSRALSSNKYYGQWAKNNPPAMLCIDGAKGRR